MHFKPTRLKGAVLIVPTPAGDERGFFMRTFCMLEFARAGLETAFVQHSTSYTKRKGTIRGMHFQTAPHSETKVVTCLKGAIHDVIIDLRSDSPTYCKWQAFELSEKNRHMLYIPTGFAHGFQTLTDDATVGYLISEFYAPHAASGVRYDDPAFAITWPLPPTMLSEKDKTWKPFERLVRKRGRPPKSSLETSRSASGASSRQSSDSRAATKAGKTATAKPGSRKPGSISRKPPAKKPRGR